MKDRISAHQVSGLQSGYFLNSAPSSANFLTIESLFYPMSGVINIHYSDVFNSVEYINIDIYISVIKPV